MKKFSLILVLLFNIVAGHVWCRPETKILSDCSVPHPRLLLKGGEEKKLLDHIASSEIWQRLHHDILSECDRITTLPLLKREKVGIRLLAVSRESLRRIFFLSYAYRMTENEKYLFRAEKEMVNVARFTDWNPSHFLDVAEMTLGMSIGYDWLFDRLPEKSKKIIREAIVEKGLKPSYNSEYNWFLNVNHNWNQVCNAGMAFGALAVYEEDSDWCRNVVSRSVDALQLPMNEYEPDGAYPEGYAYWEYGTTFNVLLLDALQKVFGENSLGEAHNGFMNTAGYYENMTGIKGDSFNYADCGSEYGLTPAMFWFADKMNDPSLLWVEKNFLSDKYRENYLKNRLLPAVMIWGAKTDIHEIVPPQRLLWCGRGITPVVLMRSSWKSPDALYVGFKGGTASSNHAHMDAGSFVMEADGVRWAMDFGRQNYESLESQKLNIWVNDQQSDRWKVFRYNNFAHNTLTVDGKLHCASGYVPILGISEHESFMSAICDLSPVFKESLSSCRRGIALVDKKYVMVRDEVVALSDRSHTVRWTLLTPAEVKHIGKDEIVLEKDGKRLAVKVVSKYPVTMKTWSTRSENSYDAANPGTIRIGFESHIDAGASADFTVFLLPGGSMDCDLSKNIPLSRWEIKDIAN